MGVLPCNRVGCENIMCDYYSEKYGYICFDCLQELKFGGYQDIATFMSFRCSTDADKQKRWEEEIEEEFKSRHED